MPAAVTPSLSTLLTLGRLIKVVKKPCSLQRKYQRTKNGDGKAKLENHEIFANSLGEIEE
jgi:hypothetical protein